jgi:aspartyl aminopeptidase
MKTPHIKNLIEFLNASPTSFQAAEQIQEKLTAKGFIKLDEADEWKLAPGKKYFTMRNQSAVIAFVIGRKKLNQTGIRLAASHLDSPALKIKPDGDKQERNNTKLAMELYGGPIVSTWLDRELSFAGRIMVKGKPILYNHGKPVAIIPNAAIHLNREVNKGFEYNAQNHLQAILQAAGKNDKAKSFKEFLASLLKVKAEDIGGFDLFLYDPAPVSLIGIDRELLVSGRLDNLAMSQAILSAMLDSESTEETHMAVFYDHEEIGSTTPEGADSSFTRDVLQRICWSQKLTQEQVMITFRKSFLISADMAHAVHPNFADKHDPAFMPLMNHGPVIKMNASQRYATTSESSTRFEKICRKTGVPFQKIINRSDMPSGSTIGPIASSGLSIPTVDVGNPMWAMHSIRETMGVYDHEYLIKALAGFFNSQD